MNDIIGLILENGEIEKGATENGFVYKNPFEFNPKSDAICYVAELDEDVLREGVGYRYDDFINASKDFIDSENEVKQYCKDNNVSVEDMANNLFEYVDWQDPHTLIEDWRNSGAYTE